MFKGKAQGAGGAGGAGEQLPGVGFGLGLDRWAHRPMRTQGMQALASKGTAVKGGDTPGPSQGSELGLEYKLQMTYGQVVGEGLLQAACKPMKLTKGKAAFGKMKLAAGGRHWGRRKQG